MSRNCLETAVSGYFHGLGTFQQGRGDFSEGLVSSLSNHLKGQLEHPVRNEKLSVCHEKSSLPISWDHLSVTKKCLSVNKNHHFLNRVVNVEK